MSASRISYQVFRVQTTLQVMYTKVGTAEPKTLQIVKNMLDIKFPEMTAYGIVELKPALIVSSFGSVLKYGLLVTVVIFTGLSGDCPIDFCGNIKYRCHSERIKNLFIKCFVFKPPSQVMYTTGSGTQTFKYLKDMLDKFPLK
ncbi:hypothetical protein CEXT_688151 [Caerostris extrusa]|uniref:Uncharacterized protein n=1 Tax=Caerostris extrusa TaxID=172846 RepID=A0AAV4UZB4_CAEEX|nr:hypothetical protein CEXT_688151 [Caerostris extrusa]